jgi:hypothetical protein
VGTPDIFPYATPDSPLSPTMSSKDLAFEAWDLSLSDSDEAESSLAMTSTQSHFLRLSRELRDIIYEYYAHEDEGLFYG